MLPPPKLKELLLSAGTVVAATFDPNVKLLVTFAAGFKAALDPNAKVLLASGGTVCSVFIEKGVATAAGFVEGFKPNENAEFGLEDSAAVEVATVAFPKLILFVVGSTAAGWLADANKLVLLVIGVCCSIDLFVAAVDTTGVPNANGVAAYVVVAASAKLPNVADEFDAEKFGLFISFDALAPNKSIGGEDTNAGLDAILLFILIAFVPLKLKHPGVVEVMLLFLGVALKEKPPKTGTAAAPPIELFALEVLTAPIPNVGTTATDGAVVVTVATGVV